MKKYLKIIIPIVVLLVVLAWLFWPASKKELDIPTPTRKVEQINKIPVADRPFVTLTPRADGKEVTLVIDNLSNADSAEYELEYQAESLIQGVFGTIDFSKDQPPVSKDLLFGSCSKGKCRFDEGVTGGSLTVRFDGGDEPYVLKTDFNLQNMFDRQGVFTSKDIKASLDVGKSGLVNGTFIVIAGTMGLPSQVEGEILAGPYSFLSATKPTLSNATVSIKSKDDLTNAKLMFWDGQAWEELEAQKAEGEISAPVTSLGVFVLVK